MRSSLFWGVVLLTAAPFFFFGGPSYHSLRSLKTGWDLGHIFFFSIFSILLFRFLKGKAKGKSCLWRCAAIFLVVLVVGIIVEFVQLYLNGRQPDVYDILRNQVGCLAGCAFLLFTTTPKRKEWWRRGAFYFFVTGCIMAATWPFVSSLVDESIARKRFPVLADFETPFEKSRWVNPDQLTLQGDIVRSGESSARIQLTTATYSGVRLFYFPGDWAGYKTLHFSIYNPDEKTLELHFRIHDEEHSQHGMVFQDRYHASFLLKHGWSDLQVGLDEVKLAPVSRSMDMGRVESLGLFVVRQSKPRIMYLDNLYLSKP